MCGAGPLLHFLSQHYCSTEQEAGAIVWLPAPPRGSNTPWERVTERKRRRLRTRLPKPKHFIPTPCAISFEVFTPQRAFLHISATRVIRTMIEISTKSQKVELFLIQISF
ncbi:hypothetical protein ILYODFUR_031728 [Ilyodon furcidens]|uniref:Uncharacterized protein n=1 Tax=Ilyodon furcidens TaxID=33524 RepID=A0ABV0UX13_9TELE